jgi:hypothetical protein
MSTHVTAYQPAVLQDRIDHLPEFGEPRIAQALLAASL